MYRFWAGLIAMALAGCAAPPVANPPPLQPQAISSDPRSQDAVRSFLEVVEIVEPVAEAECRSRTSNVDCDFQIVVDDRFELPPNAFQTLDENGRPIIGFTVALIADVRNQDELAFILSHEAAHHIQGHLSEQQRNAAIGAAVFGQLAGAIGGQDVARAQEIGAVLGARSYSKEFELEADELGTIITARAGFNPLRGADFFFRIPDPGNRFLGTHPANADRVAVVRRTAAGLGFQ